MVKMLNVLSVREQLIKDIRVSIQEEYLLVVLQQFDDEVQAREDLS
jgi:hypothetical protein